MQKNNSMLCVCFAILRKTRRCDGHHIKGVFKGGGGSGGSNPPPPPEIFRFFLKSEGKEIERKRKKGCWGGGAS